MNIGQTWQYVAYLQVLGIAWRLARQLSSACQIHALFQMWRITLAAAVMESREIKWTLGRCAERLKSLWHVWCDPSCLPLIVAGIWKVLEGTKSYISSRLSLQPEIGCFVEKPLTFQACKTSCKKGYTPSEKKMDCYAQVLTPRTFECLEDPCPIPFAKNQEGSGCVGVPGRVDGTVIESGDTCRTECKEGSSAAGGFHQFYCTSRFKIFYSAQSHAICVESLSHSFYFVFNFHDGVLQ